MNLVFLAHPDFVGHQSMPRFTKMLAEGMASRGHHTQVVAPKAVFSRLSRNAFARKWLGYVDQYLIFPFTLKKLIRRVSPDSLFVFTDQTLGPWVPMASDRPHVIHCHDFLALRSALGEIEENPTGWSGRLYQRLIRSGFSKGRNFISVSQKTRADLHKFVKVKPEVSEVVYNGLHQKFTKHDPQVARATFGQHAGLDLGTGYLLHVGGNAWYKNRLGVIEIYEAWRKITGTPLPLILVGEPLSGDALGKVESSPFANSIHQLSDVSDEQIVLAYAGASIFLFPSLGEGFGWPIAEAMASGTVVITTGEVPMSEVAGDAAYLIPRRPAGTIASAQWANDAARIVERIVTLSPEDREQFIAKGISNARRFDTARALEQIEAIYKKVLNTFRQPYTRTTA